MSDPDVGDDPDRLVLLSAASASVRYPLSRSQLLRLARCGRIRHTRINGRALFEPSDIEQFLADAVHEVGDARPTR